MTTATPSTELNADFSQPDADPTPWSEAQRVLEVAEVFWLATVRADGRPHVTPVLAVWFEGAAYFCTGPDERKAANLATNAACTLTTGCNLLSAGLDVVVEGEARMVRDEDWLRLVAEAYRAKYGDDWSFEVEDVAFTHRDGGRALVYEVAPVTVFGFRKGAYSQTRWRF